jgi:hypothetical protein
MTKLFVVCSEGGAWSNDDEAAPGPAGVYSSMDAAKQHLRKMMLDELTDVDAEDDGPAFDTLSFEDLESKWSDLMETEPFVIYERVLDAPVIDVHACSTVKS